MRTITDYTIFCTEEQTKKALNLDAPLEIGEGKGTILCRYKNYHTYKRCIIPTAEQMINWLETTLIYGISISEFEGEWIYSIRTVSSSSRIHNEYFPSSSRSEATLAAIDAALDYLSKNKK